MSPLSIRRRGLIQAVGCGPLALSLPSFGAAPRAERLLVMVFLYGGNDSYNTWVPFSDELYYRVRPTIAVPRDPVLKITDRHGFHPSFASLMPAWHSREIQTLQDPHHSQAPHP